MPNQRFQHEEPSVSDIQYLEDRLYEFNKDATGISDGQGLGLFLRDSKKTTLLARPVIPGVRLANSGRSGSPSLCDARASGAACWLKRRQRPSAVAVGSSFSLRIVSRPHSSTRNSASLPCPRCPNIPVATGRLCSGSHSGSTPPNKALQLTALSAFQLWFGSLPASTVGGSATFGRAVVRS